MISQKYEKKFDEEREMSIELKAKLVAHLPTREAAQRRYEERCLRVQEIVREMLVIREGGGSALKLSVLTRDLRTSQTYRDTPLSQFNITLKDILNQLERAVLPFIQLRAGALEDLKKKIPSMRINRETSHTKNVEGRKVYLVESNLEGVAAFQDKLLESLQCLRQMKSSSIPEIESYCEQIEKERAEIDLTPVPVEQDGRVFSDLREAERDSKEKAELQSGYPTTSGVVLLEKGKKSTLVQTSAEADKSLFDAAANLMDHFK